MEVSDIQFTAPFWQGIKPEPRYLLSEWADEHRYLSSVSAAEPGRFKTSRTPYLKQIMDDLSMSSEYQEVIFMKGVQLGASESAYNLVGYCMDIAPCPILYVLPTVEMCITNSKTRLSPMIEASPRLRAKVKPARTKDADNTLMQKTFNGGMFRFGGANAAAGLRNMPIRVLILDEPDAYPLDLDGEGSPVALAEKRTSTFGNRKKVYKLSTPTLEATSIIEREYLSSVQNKYYVPCPHCGTFQTFEFDNLKWDVKKYKTVRYICAHCGDKIEEKYKTEMLSAGEWRMQAPENYDGVRVSYHLNSLYSPVGWYSWSEIAKDYETKALKDVNEEKTFTNTVLGQTWKDKGDAPEWEPLYNRARVNPYEAGKIPSNNVAFLTAGVDVQRDRLEIEVVGWMYERRSYSIEYVVLLGDTSGAAVWNKLTDVLSRQYERPDGAMLSISLTAIDSGYNAQQVYNYCKTQQDRPIIAVKGSDAQQVMVAQPRAVNINKKTGKKEIGGVKIWHVGVSLIKSELYGWLRQERGDPETDPPPGFCWFPQYDQHYFKGLTAERLEFKMNKGFRKYEWVKKFDRNEPLDTRVYARAAANVYGMDRFNEVHFKELAQSHFSAPEKPAAPPRRKSNFW